MHYFPLRKNNKDNNVIITWVQKIKKLLPFFTHSGLNKVYISLASLGKTIFDEFFKFVMWNNHPVCKYKRATEMNWKGLLVGTSRVGNFAVLPWYISILKVAMIQRSVTNLTLQNRSPRHPGTEKYLSMLLDPICKLYCWIFAAKLKVHFGTILARKFK